MGVPIFLFMASVFLVFQPSVGAAKSIIPSFNCKYAKLASEKAICANDELSALDTAMVALYEVAMARTNSRARLENSQIRWRARRDRCGGNFQCILRSYRQRNSQLEREAGIRLTPRESKNAQSTGGTRSLKPGQQRLLVEGWCADFHHGVLESMSRCTGVIETSGCEGECSTAARFLLVGGSVLQMSGAEESHSILGRSESYRLKNQCWVAWDETHAFCYSLVPNFTYAFR